MVTPFAPELDPCRSLRDPSHSQPAPLTGVPAHVARAWFQNQRLAEAVVPRGALRIALAAVAIAVGVLIGVGGSHVAESPRRASMVRAIAPSKVPVIPVRYVDGLQVGLVR